MLEYCSGHEITKFEGYQTMHMHRNFEGLPFIARCSGWKYNDPYPISRFIKESVWVKCHTIFQQSEK